MQKDSAELKIFQKVLGGLLFWNTLYTWFVTGPESRCIKCQANQD